MQTKQTKTVRIKNILGNEKLEKVYTSRSISLLNLPDICSLLLFLLISLSLSLIIFNVLYMPFSLSLFHSHSFHQSYSRFQAHYSCHSCILALPFSFTHSYFTLSLLLLSFSKTLLYLPFCPTQSPVLFPALSHYIHSQSHAFSQSRSLFHSLHLALYLTL